MGLDKVQTFERALPGSVLGDLTRLASPDHMARLHEEGFRFYRTTFWYPLDRPPANNFEIAIRALRDFADPPISVVGVEWWFSVMRTDATPQWLLAPHFDRSNLAEKDPEKVTHPDRASVLFLNGVPHSELVITDQVLTARGVRPKQPTEMIFVEPRRNRYVVFPGHLYHGVIGRMWRPAGPPRFRISLAVNWWSERPTAGYLLDSVHCLAALGLARQ